MEPRISIITLGVKNLERSFEFYTALGFVSSKKPEDGIVFFNTGGVCLALYPLDDLAKDVSPSLNSNRPRFQVLRWRTTLGLKKMSTLYLN